MTSQLSETGPGAPEPRLQSITEYTRQLDCCTQLPRQRVEDFMCWSESDVRRESHGVAQVLKRFARAVVRSMDEPNDLDDFLVNLDLKTISRDHDWRTIFEKIRDFDDADGAQYKRTTLIKYLQYLSFRKRLLDHIHTRKAGLAETCELVKATDFTSAAQDTAATISSGLSRMPLGECIDVRLGDEEVLEIVLGRNMFELVGGPHPYLADENGVTCFVREGRNVVGRHPESDLTVDANFSNVSRAHLILEWDGAQRFKLMDLSTRGSWLREDVLRVSLRTLESALP